MKFLDFLYDAKLVVNDDIYGGICDMITTVVNLNEREQMKKDLFELLDKMNKLDVTNDQIFLFRESLRDVDLDEINTKAKTLEEFFRNPFIYEVEKGTREGSYEVTMLTRYLNDKTREPMFKTYSINIYDDEIILHENSTEFMENLTHRDSLMVC